MMMANNLDNNCKLNASLFMAMVALRTACVLLRTALVHLAMGTNGTSQIKDKCCTRNAFVYMYIPCVDDQLLFPSRTFCNSYSFVSVFISGDCFFFLLILALQMHFEWVFVLFVCCCVQDVLVHTLDMLV